MLTSPNQNIPQGYVPVTITLEQMQTVAKAVARAIVQPGAYTDEGVSLDTADKGVAFNSTQATKLDALGWILRLTARLYPPKNVLRNADFRGYRIADLINSIIVEETSGKLSLITLSDKRGPQAVADTLLRIAELKELPVICAPEN